MDKKLIVLIIIVGGIFALAGFSKLGNLGTGFIWQISNGGKLLLPLVAVSALIDSINPCAFSILILTIAFLFSLGKMRSDILRVGGFYILGIFIAYLLIGLGIAQVLHLFNTPHFMAKVGAVLLIGWGLLGLINEFFPSFPLKLHVPKAAHQKMAQLMEKASLPAAFLLGGLVGVCEFPCTGGPYLMVLGLLHDKTTFAPGLAYLVFYNLLFVLPLVVILLIASNNVFLEKVQAWKSQNTKLMRFLVALAMILLGLIIWVL